MSVVHLERMQHDVTCQTTEIWCDSRGWWGSVTVDIDRCTCLRCLEEVRDTRVKQLEGALGEALALIDSRILAYGPDEYASAARLRCIQRGIV